MSRNSASSHSNFSLLQFQMTPDFFLAHDNVVVYLTFRVDIYGFVNLGIGEYTGNMALKDQQLGMKWVYDNIEFFSGNKSQILLFGDSSGKSPQKIGSPNSHFPALPGTHAF